MLTDHELRELIQFISPAPVLSLYLNTDPSAGNKDAYRLRLRNLLKRVDLPQDVERIEHYFQHEYDWAGHGVAVFSCAPENFFQTYSLAVPVRDLLHVSDRASVRQLTDLLDSYGGYGVVLVDKQGARVFHFHLGQLQEQEGVVGEAVKHVKRGGASTVAGARGGTAGQTRYMEEVVDRNMKEAMDFAVGFFEENKIRRILVGGSDENVKMFLNHLPKAWQSLVVGSFTMSMTATHADVLARAMQIGAEAELKRESHLIETLITSAAKKSGAVLGMEATLDALNNERVNTLVVLEGHQQSAYRCSVCTYLTLDPIRTCPHCGGEIFKVVDIVELAVNRSMRKGGDVEVVHESEVLDKSGKIGAFLRY